MFVKPLNENNRTGISACPETGFEEDFLSRCFVGKDKRIVIVKSGSSLDNVLSVDIFTEQEKQYATDNLLKEMAEALEESLLLCDEFAEVNPKRIEQRIKNVLQKYQELVGDK